MKRRTVSQREEAEARAKAGRHREELLADLQAREAARRDTAVPSTPYGSTEQPPAESSATEVVEDVEVGEAAETPPETI